MKVRLDIFEGPLDLLLYLIKKEHLNISDISLTQVVEQYLQFLELMKLLDINIASEYMLIAAHLISLKSKMLLPEEEKQPEEAQESQDELVRRLLEYEKFKEAADFLRQKEAERNRYFVRAAANPEYIETYIEASIFDLISAFKAALKEVPKDIFFEVVSDEFTVEQKIHDILHLLLVRPKIGLDELFNQAKNKLEIVVIFLALLELIKLKELVAVQEELFGPISIMRREIAVSSM